VGKKIRFESKRKDIAALLIAIIIVGTIFSPYPGIDAVTVVMPDVVTSIDGADPDAADDKLSIDVTVKADAGITFGDGSDEETLSKDAVIRVVLNPDAADETVALFDMSGNRLDNSLLQSGQKADTKKIVSLSSPSVTRVSDTASGFFDYGNFYGYGYGIFGGVESYGIIGTGVYGYGLSSNEFTPPADTKGAYTLKVNPEQLTSDSNNIRIDILESASASNFLSSGVLTVANTITGTVTETTVPDGSDAYIPPASTTTLNVESSTLPTTIVATSEQVLDFSNAPDIETVGGETKVTVTDQESTVTATVSGQVVSIVYPPNVVATAVVDQAVPWDNKLAVPTVTTSAAPPAESGTTNTVQKVVTLGSGNTRVTYDQALHIILTGSAGDS